MLILKMKTRYTIVYTTVRQLSTLTTGLLFLPLFFGGLVAILLAPTRWETPEMRLRGMFIGGLFSSLSRLAYLPSNNHHGARNRGATIHSKYILVWIHSDKLEVTLGCQCSLWIRFWSWLHCRLARIWNL